uniref:Putative secreted salivary gland protein n=1 Tax=Ixodes ricinus TaxID=34613 RepID=A0A147BWD9_IXORI
MYRNISIVVFVFFAVVLGLPESQGEVYNPASVECYLYLLESGKIYCQLSGHNTFNGLDFQTCYLVCGVSKVKLPEKACTNGSLHKCD